MNPFSHAYPTSKPSDPSLGDAHIDTATGELNVFDGSNWLTTEGAVKQELPIKVKLLLNMLSENLDKHGIDTVEKLEEALNANYILKEIRLNYISGYEVCHDYLGFTTEEEDRLHEVKWKL